MSLFAELKRRNVLRAAALYVAAAWALAQGVAQLLPVFGAGDWATRWFVIAAVIGFPFWIAFAWFYEFTPSGLKRESDIDPSDSIVHRTSRKLDFWIIGVLAVAVVLLLTNQFVLRRDATSVADAATVAAANKAAIPVPERSIAVLPFVNRSTDKDQEFFSDGISEDMLNLLAKVPQLKVISRSSSFSFKGKDVPLKEIAQTLGVAYILEGSVQRAGDTLRISAQLVDARRDQNVWSQRWDRPFGDVFKIQDEIAGAVVGQLKLKLLGKAKEIDPESYATYLQARQLARQGTRAGYEQAAPLLQQVLSKAPNYAPAWTQLAAIYSNQAGQGLRPYDEGQQLARNAVMRALAEDPGYAPAYAVLGIQESDAGNLEAATKHFERALNLDPDSASVLGNAGNLAMFLGRADLAIALAEASVARDPVNASNFTSLGSAFMAAKRFDDATTSYAAALRLSPDLGIVHGLLALVLLRKGDAKGALAELEKEPEKIYRAIYSPIVYQALGRKADADAALAVLIDEYEQVAAFNIASVFAYRGEVDRAFEWLDKAQAYDDPGLSEIVYERPLDNLKQDPRWLPLLRKLGKAPEQLAKIQFNPTLPDDPGAPP